MQSSSGEEVEIFRRHTAALGRPLLREDLAPRVNAFYGDIAERANDLISKAKDAVPELPSIYFDFIVNPQVNAFAFRANGQYFIGLNTGAVFMLRLVIGRMLSDSHCFRSVGHPETESDDLKPIADYLPNANSMYRDNPLLIPKDDVRGAYADFLTDQAVMFFIGHELTHISHGHVDYLSEVRGISKASESAASESDEAEIRFERQCLEQDADRRSIVSRADSLRVTFAHPDYAGRPWAKSEIGVERLVRDWSVSLNIVFHLFGDPRFSDTELKDANYPPLPVRRLYAEAVAHQEIVTKWCNGKFQSVGDALRQGRFDAAEAFSYILHEPVSVSGLRESQARIAYEHAVRLNDYWNSTMVEKLRPYSYEF